MRKKIPSGFKHGGYSVIGVLPGEDASAFQKLHRSLIIELSPQGSLEKMIVAEIARLSWRIDNLGTLRRAELENQGHPAVTNIVFEWIPRGERVKQGHANDADRSASERAAKEAPAPPPPATFSDLTKELDAMEKLIAQREKCLKQLFMVRGLKSMPASASNRIAAPNTGPKNIASSVNTLRPTRLRGKG
jgi:hypothetical protein